MRIIKYSRISKINLGDVIISDAINFIDNEFFKNTIDNQDILLKNFNLDKRLSESQKSKNSVDYKIRKYSFLKYAVYLYKRLIFIFKDKRKILKQIKNNDIVVIGGGNLLAETFSNDMFFRICQIANMAEKNNKPIIVLAIGIGELKFLYKQRLKKLINKSKVFSVRDDISKTTCEEIHGLNKKIHKIIDPAFIISDYYPAIENEKKYIGFNFMNLKRINQDNSHDLDEISGNLSKLSKYYKKPVKIINTSFGEDLAISRIIKLKLDNLNVSCEIFNVKNVNDLPKAFCDLEFFIANRMHSSIFSMSYNIKTITYPWDKKIIILNKMIFGEDKYEELLLNSINFDANEIINKIEKYEKVINLKSIIDDVKSEIIIQHKELF